MVVTKKQSLSSTHVNGDSTHNKQRNIKASTIHVDELQVDGIVIANGIITLPSTGDIRIAGDSLFSINPIRVDSININANAVITAHVGDDQITESKLDSALRTKLNSGDGGNGGNSGNDDNSGNHGLKVDYFDALPLLNLINAPQVGMVLLSRTTTQLVIKVTPPINHQLWFLPNDHRVSLHKLRVKVYDDDLKAITREYVEVHNDSHNTLYDLVSVTLNFEAGTTDTSLTNPVAESIIGCSSTILKTPASSVPYTGPFKVEMGYVSDAFQQNTVSTLSGLQLLTAGYAQAVPQIAFNVTTSNSGNRDLTVSIDYSNLDHDLATSEVQTTPGLNGVLVGIFGIHTVGGRAVTTEHTLPIDIRGDFNVGNGPYNASRVRSFSSTPSSVTFNNVGLDMQFRVFVMVKNNTQVAGNTATTDGRYETQASLAFSKIHTTSNVLGAYSQNNPDGAVVANIGSDTDVVHKDEEYYSFEYDPDAAYNAQSNHFLTQFPDRIHFVASSFQFNGFSLGENRSYKQVASNLSDWETASIVQRYLYINTGAAILTMTLSNIQVPKYGTYIDKLGVVILKINNQSNVQSVTIDEPITPNDTPWNFSGGLQSSFVSQTQTNTLHTHMSTTLSYTVTDIHADNDNKRNVFIDLNNLVATVSITTSTPKNIDYTIDASYTHPVINNGNPNNANNSRIYRFIDRPSLTQSIEDFTCSSTHMVCGRLVVGNANGQFQFVVTVKLQSSHWMYIPGDLTMYKLKIDNITTNPNNFVKLDKDMSNPDASNEVTLATNTNTNDFTFTHTVTKEIIGLDSTMTVSVTISPGLDYFYDVSPGVLTRLGRIDYLSRAHKHHSNTNVGNKGTRLDLTGDPYESIKTLLDGTTTTANTHFNSTIADSDYFKSIGLTDEYLKNLNNFDHATDRTSDNSLLMHNGEYYFPGNAYRAEDGSDFTPSLEHSNENRCLLLRYDNITTAERFVVLQFDTDNLNARLTDKMYMWAKVVVSTTGSDDQSLHWNSVQFQGDTRNTTTAIDASLGNVIAYAPAVGEGMRVSTGQLTADLDSTAANTVQSKPRSVLIDTGASWETVSSSEKHLYVLLVCLKNKSDVFTNITAEGYTAVTATIVTDMG